MVLYRKIEKDGEQVIYEELEVVPSKQLIRLGAAYNHLMETCLGMTAEVAIDLLTLIHTSSDVPITLYGEGEDS